MSISIDVFLYNKQQTKQNNKQQTNKQTKTKNLTSYNNVHCN